MGLFKTAQRNYCEFYTKDVWDEERAAKHIGVYYTEERLDYIHRFYECLLNSEKMNELGLMYLRHSNLSVRKVVELYNKGKAEKNQLNENTGKSRIIACANKVNNSFSDMVYKKKKKDPLDWIINIGALSEYNEAKMEMFRECQKQIDEFIEMFDSTSKNKKEKMIIKIPAFAKVSELSEEDFENFMEIIRPYSKRHIDCIQQCISQMKEEVGYFNFLMSAGVKLTEVDKERRRLVLRWLGIKEDDGQSNKEDDADGEFESDADVIW